MAAAHLVVVAAAVEATAPIDDVVFARMNRSEGAGARRAQCDRARKAAIATRRAAICRCAGERLPQAGSALHDRTDPAIHRVPIVPNRRAQPNHPADHARKLAAEGARKYAAEAVTDDRDTAAGLARDSCHSRFKPLEFLAWTAEVDVDTRVVRVVANAA